MNFGEHGILDVDLEKNKINNIKFIKLDERIFEEINLDVSKLNSQEEIIEKINELNLEEKNNYKIILIGNKRTEINTKEIIKLVSHDNILKIYDETEVEYEIEKIIEQDNLKGLFVKELLSEINNEQYSEEEIKKILKMGLQLF